MKGKIKRLLYRLIVLAVVVTTLLVATISPASVLQPSAVYAAPETETLRPNAAGDETGLSFGGTTPADSNWESVDEDSSDDDVTYVESGAGVYETDLYNLADTALYGTINSVTVFVNCKGTKVGVFSAYTRIKTNGVAHDGSEITLTTTYVTYSTAYTTNPQTTAAWTWAEVNALQAGVALKKPTGGATSRCTQVWVVVNYTPGLPPSISNTPDNYAFGTVAEGSITATVLTYFTVTNNSAFAVNITISGTDMTGGVPWTLSDTATQGPDTCGLKAGLEGGDYTIVVKKSSPNFLVENLAASGLQGWGLQLLAPTTFSDGGTKTGTVTLTATQA